MGSNFFFCPLCVGEEHLPFDTEAEFVHHLENAHLRKSKIDLEIECPICISEGSFKVGEKTSLKAHLELHRYRLQQKEKRVQKKREKGGGKKKKKKKKKKK